MSEKSNPIAWTVAGVLVLYLGSYCILSSRGCYVPGAWGLGTVKWYEWAPQGFASGQAGTKRNRSLEMFYFPAWIADNKFVHTFEKKDSGQYLINTLLERQLQVSTSNWNKKVALEWNEQNLQGGTNGRQPFSSETNRTSTGAASHR